MTKLKYIILSFVFAFSTTQAFSAEGWDFSFTPYGWFAGMDGSVEVDGTTADFDADFSDIVENLDFAVFISTEASTEDFFILADLIYLELSQESTVGGVDARTEIDEFILTGAFGVPVRDTPLEVFVGLRTVDLDAAIAVSGPGGVAVRANGSTLVDAVAGARIKLALSDNVGLGVVGDVSAGGTDFSWEVVATLNYQFSDLVTGRVGYRVLDLDIDDDVVANITTSGWLLGVGFNF